MKPSERLIINILAMANEHMPLEFPCRYHKGSHQIARQVTAYIVRSICPGLSFPQIGRALGHADHTSACHAYHIMPKRAAESAEMAAFLNMIAAQIRFQNPDLIKNINAAHAAGG